MKRTIIILLTAGLAVLFAIPSFAGFLMTIPAGSVMKDGFEIAGLEGAGEFTVNDLSYWYGPIDEAVYAQRIRNATGYVASAGLGNCSTWVSEVYQAAGLVYIGGDACDMWRNCCLSRNIDNMREGMLIAVRQSTASELGMIYGHVGILIKNPSYNGTDNGKIIKALLDAILVLDEQLTDIDDLRRGGAVLARKRYYLSLAEDYMAVETDQYYYSSGVLIQADQYGNEKWLVADSTSTVGYTTLSKWLSIYNAYGTVAWGWGHK